MISGAQGLYTSVNVIKMCKVNLTRAETRTGYTSIVSAQN